MTQDGPSIKVERQGPITLVRLMDSRILDEMSVRQVGLELLELAGDRQNRWLVIDLGNVEYLSSSVLGKLLKINKQLALNKGKLKLCGIRPSIMEVFRITQLDKLFEIHPDAQGAVSSF